MPHAKKNRFLWQGYSFAQEQVVKKWREEAIKEMIAKGERQPKPRTSARSP